MQTYTLTQLNRALGNSNFKVCLKYDRVCLVRRNQQLAYLLPVEENPDRRILKSMPISLFRQSIGFHIDLLIDDSKKQGKSVAYALTDAGSERICYLAIALPE